ncbi:MAG: beta-propeller domain-containing protein, partial [Anaerolineales bacterium]|nr:beta-propeller domain-containing protein [Anaerolineales bacterium]
PVLIAERDENESDSRRGDYVWQGAFVFDISAEEGISLRGGITHYDDGFEAEQYWHRNGSLNDIKRSLYIGDVLYTISNGKIKMNDLETLDYINKVEFN